MGKFIFKGTCHACDADYEIEVEQRGGMTVPLTELRALHRCAIGTNVYEPVKFTMTGIGEPT